jgi:uncharacterized protein (TIGR02058 family)
MPPERRKETRMARVRCITEMGMGVDVHGRDATKAAKRAVSDAIRHSSLGFFRMLGKTANDMFVDVTIGVPDPGAVDTGIAGFSSAIVAIDNCEAGLSERQSLAWRQGVDI